MRHNVVLAASLLLFLLFGAAWIHVPGPEQDELLHLPVLSPVLHHDVLFAMNFQHGRWLPLMVMSYVGALKGWLLWLWFLVVPTGVPGYRALGLVLGAATIWLIFWFVRRYYGVPVACLTTILTATDPSFVHTIRLDYGPVAMMQFLKMAGLCALARWLETGSRRALAGGMFLFGLGLWDKANFIWFLAGLSATVVLLFPRETLGRLRANPSVFAVAVAAFLVGAAPFIGYNLKRRGETWREHHRLELRWFKLLEAKGTLEGTFMSVLTGEPLLDSSPPAHDIVFPHLADWMYRLGRQRETIILPLLGLALAALPFNLWVGARRRLLFPLLLSLLIYACMFFTFDGGASVHHVVMIQPFPLLFLAASLWTPAERWPRFAPRAAAVAVTLAAVAVNLSLNARHLAIYTRTGGTSGFTDAVYKLVPYLARHPERKLYAIDWGLSYPIVFLGMPWNLNVDDIFFALYEANDPSHSRQVDRLAALMGDPNNVFLLHSPQRTLFPTPAREFHSLAESGIEMRRVAFFEERCGDVVFEIYEHGTPERPVAALPEVQVQFIPDRVGPSEEYTIVVEEFPGAWIDLVYDVDQASGATATRFCQLDAAGRARVTVPVTHPAATVHIRYIRPSGGQWRPARGAITVVRK